VLVVQSQGTGAGAWEEATVVLPSGGALALTAPLGNTYSAGAQVVRIAQYTSAQIKAGGSLVADPWNGSSGGVIAIRVQGTFTIAAGGSVQAIGAGFRGGISNGSVETFTSTGPNAGESFTGPSQLSVVVAEPDGTYASLPNGGGGAGGITINGEGMTGGNGGSYGSAGLLGPSGNQISVFSKRAYAYGDPDLATLFFGSGGGAGSNSYNSGNPPFHTQPAGFGNGGAGGGIIFISANQLANQGMIIADGGPGTSGTLTSPNGNECLNIYGGGGGGGAGGSIRISTFNGNAGLLSAEGGGGGPSLATCYGGWRTAPIGGSGGSGRTKLRTGVGGFVLSQPDPNTVRLTSTGPTATAQIVVKQ
jgi:hypothetical protein